MTKAEIVMSWSTTQRAIYNQVGFLSGAGFKTPEDQEAYRQQLIAQLARGEDA